MRKAYLEVVCIHGVQRDLVVDRILFCMYLLKLYKYKRAYDLKMAKHDRNI